jgi:hypothetical protein
MAKLVQNGFATKVGYRSDVSVIPGSLRALPGLSFQITFGLMNPVPLYQKEVLPHVQRTQEPHIFLHPGEQDYQHPMQEGISNFRDSVFARRFLGVAGGRAVHVYSKQIFRLERAS